MHPTALSLRFSTRSRADQRGSPQRGPRRAAGDAGRWARRSMFARPGPAAAANTTADPRCAPSALAPGHARCGRSRCLLCGLLEVAIAIGLARAVAGRPDDQPRPAGQRCLVDCSFTPAACHIRPLQLRRVAADQWRELCGRLALAGSLLGTAASVMPLLSLPGAVER
jgi:hypothetical protein